MFDSCDMPRTEPGSPPLRRFRGRPRVPRVIAISVDLWKLDPNPQLQPHTPQSRQYFLRWVNHTLASAGFRVTIDIASLLMEVTGSRWLDWPRSSLVQDGMGGSMGAGMRAMELWQLWQTRQACERNNRNLRVIAPACCCS